jgi:hypothetical protein
MIDGWRDCKIGGAVCDDGLVAIGSDWVWDGGGAYDLLAGGGGRQRGAEAGAP